MSSTSDTHDAANACAKADLSEAEAAARADAEAAVSPSAPAAIDTLPPEERPAAYKAEFVRAITENVKRPGVQNLLDWLERTDFYTAPASTRFHGACACGLVMHSLNVYHVLMSRFYTEEDSLESFTLISLLHDLCKANYYKSGFRNVKNDATGQWEKVPSYSVQDAFPYGHGEKSVYLIERFVRLKPAEAIAIRWHMGGFDDAVRGGSYAISNAYDEYPLAVKLHIADLEATYLVEKGTSNVPR